MSRRLPHVPSERAVGAGEVFGLQIAVFRRLRHWTQKELASRIGVTPATVSRLERGDLTVDLGVYLEAATVLLMPLFNEDIEPGRWGSPLTIPRRMLELRLALLGSRVVPHETRVDDDF